MIIQTHTSFSWRIFSLLLVLIAGFAIVQGHAFIFGPPIMETGDFAANAMVMYDAKSFHDIYGNYSRWGFNHPGPFFFYWYTLGELIFYSGLHLVASPHQAHVLSGIFLQAGLLAAAITLLTAASRRVFTAPVLLAVAAFILLHAGNVISSIWMPHVLLGPYILLLVSGALIARGNLRLLPIAVLMTCILCHGHVAQPLMTIPVLGFAISGWILLKHRGGLDWRTLLRASVRDIAISCVIVGIFLIPIIIDLTLCPDCNAQRILGYMRQDHGAMPKWRQAVNSIAALFRFDHNPERVSDFRHISWFTKDVITMLAVAVGSFAVSTLVARRKPQIPGSQDLRTAVRFALLGLVLSCIWAKRITGPLYEFNSYFVYGVYFLLVACSVASATLLISGLTARRTTVAIGWALTIVVTALSPKLSIFSQSNVAIDKTPIDEPPYVGRVALLELSSSEDWPSMTALATWVYRSGSYYLSPHDWAYVFGWKHGADNINILAAGDKLDIWNRVHSDTAAIKTFSPTDYCRITDNSPYPEDLEGGVRSLAPARDKCALTVFGVSKNTGASFSWTTTNPVLMQFRAKQVSTDASVLLKVAPFTADGHLTHQRASVSVNGVSVATFDIKAEQTLQITVPADVWNRRNVITMEIQLPDATSPSALGMSGDTRRLGLGIFGMGLLYH